MIYFPACALIEKGDEYSFAVPSLPEYRGVRDVFICARRERMAEVDGGFFVSVPSDFRFEIYPAFLLCIGYKKNYPTYSLSASHFEDLSKAFSEKRFIKARKRICARGISYKFVFFPFHKAYIYEGVEIGDLEKATETERYKKMKDAGDIREESGGFFAKIPSRIKCLEGLGRRDIKKLLKRCETND